MVVLVNIINVNICFCIFQAFFIGTNFIELALFLKITIINMKIL